MTLGRQVIDLPGLDIIDQVAELPGVAQIAVVQE
jgi:hypothetical protein